MADWVEILGDERVSRGLPHAAGPNKETRILQQIEKAEQRIATLRAKLNGGHDA